MKAERNIGNLLMVVMFTCMVMPQNAFAIASPCDGYCYQMVHHTDPPVMGPLQCILGEGILKHYDVSTQEWCAAQTEACINSLRGEIAELCAFYAEYIPSPFKEK